MLFPLVLGTAGMAFGYTTYPYPGISMNITNQGCIDEPGFLVCQSKIKPSKKLNYNDRNCVGREEELACFASHCWNKVYQCEYQQNAIKFIGKCSPSTQIPYFPAPANATNGCSCNLGNVYLAISNTTSKGISCQKEVRKQNTTDREEEPQNIRQGEHCKCCQISGSYASLDAICPNTNPLDIGFKYVAQMNKRADLDFNTCEKYIMQRSCVQELGFPESVDGAFRSMTYLAASNLMSFTESNTAMVTNNVGTILSPPGGSTFTWMGKPRSWVHGNSWETSKPTYTVTAVTAAPSPVDADVTRAEEITPAPTMTPSYTLNIFRLKSDGGVIGMERKPRILILAHTAAFVLGFLL